METLMLIFALSCDIFLTAVSLIGALIILWDIVDTIRHNGWRWRLLLNIWGVMVCIMGILMFTCMMIPDIIKCL